LGFGFGRAPATRHPFIVKRRKMDPSSSASDKRHRLEGKYANHFAVGYNAYEFIFDFGQSYSENDEAELSVRVVTSPFYAKEFLKTLQKSVAQFEQTYGSNNPDK
jgi:hypothetical protein